MTCPACGAQASEGARFCRSCGSPLTAPQGLEPSDRSEADKVATSQAAAPSPRGRGGRRRAVAAVAVAAVLSGSAIAFMALRSRKAPSTEILAPTSEATSTPSGQSRPDARAVAVASLVPAGTTPTDVLYGDLDGSGPEEIVVVAAGPKLRGVPAGGMPFRIEVGVA